MRRIAVAFLALGMALAVPGIAAADHPAPGFPPVPLPSSDFQQGGEGAEFELIKTLVTGNPHTDLDFFTKEGSIYASVGTLAVGPNQAGQSIVKLTDDTGEVSADTIDFVSGHPSATCVSDPSAALGLQHDVEASPKGTFTNATDANRSDGDAQILIDATDARGRCHDQGDLGLVGAPLGGLEIIDITDVEAPVEIGLTTHIGQAHTVNVDPRRPHIAYAVSSDRVAVDEEGHRANEDRTTKNALGQDVANSARFNLDGWEVLDLSSCMYFPPGTSTADKRDACRPEVYRYRYPTIDFAIGHTNENAVYGCHELEVYDNDRLTCGGGAAAMVFDIAGTFDDNGTPNNFRDDKPRGTPLDCEVRPSSSVAGFETGAMVTDCAKQAPNAEVIAGTDDELSIPTWIEDGAPSLQGVRHLGSAHHQGRQGNGEDVTDPAFPASEDIDFDHELEYTQSRDFIIGTDERGGGVLPPGATCARGIDNPVGNGGLHAYAVDRLQTSRPDSPEEAFKAYALTPDGEKAIFRTPIETAVEPSTCTAHVFQQVPGQNRIFMAWYSQGTQVIDYRENKDGTFEFARVGYFIPEDANQWVSHVFKHETNQDGSITYYGVAGDFRIESGRNAIDVYKATLPPVGAAFGVGNKGGDRDPDINRPDGVGNTGDGRNPTLPATGIGVGLIPVGITLLGASAWIGRSRRKDADIG